MPAGLGGAGSEALRQETAGRELSLFLHFFFVSWGRSQKRRGRRISRDTQTEPAMWPDSGRALCTGGCHAGSLHYFRTSFSILPGGASPLSWHLRNLTRACMVCMYESWAPIRHAGRTWHHYLGGSTMFIILQDSGVQRATTPMDESSGHRRGGGKPMRVRSVAAENS